MIENVEKFMQRYETLDALRQKVTNALNAYPGSWENREYMVEDVLLPIAEEEGLPFTLEELRKYETRLKMSRSLDVDISDQPDEEYVYWLLDRGWTTDESKYEESSD